MTGFPSCRAFLLFVLTTAAPSVCHAIFFNNPILIPRLECFLKFALLNFDPSNFELYDSYFRNESLMELAQAGQYLGPNGIQEYVRFSYGEFSQYLATGPSDRKTDVSYQGYENGQCVFLVIYNSQYSMDPIYTSSNATFRTDIMFKVFFDFGDNYISRINVFFSDAFLTTFFNDFLNTDKTRQFVCDTMTGPTCVDIIETPVNCLDTLKTLPITDEREHIDGNSQGCRALHAVFASVNDVHCPHISFASQEDVDGKIKCQTVGNSQPEDLFTADEITKFFEAGQAAGIDPATGIKLVDPLPTSPPKCGLFGLGLLCLNGCGFFGRLLGLCATA